MLYIRKVIVDYGRCTYTLRIGNRETLIAWGGLIVDEGLYERYLERKNNPEVDAAGTTIRDTIRKNRAGYVRVRNENVRDAVIDLLLTRKTFLIPASTSQYQSQ